MLPQDEAINELTTSNARKTTKMLTRWLAGLPTTKAPKAMMKFSQNQSSLPSLADLSDS